VTNLIHTIGEPQRLILAWQAPDHLGNRYRWAVGVVSPVANDWHLRYFEAGSEFEQFNPGEPYESLIALGYKGYAAFDPGTKVHTLGVLAAFMRRVPPRNRADFGEYRSAYHLSPEATLSDIGLLAVTEAKLPSDGFSLVDTLDPHIGHCDLFLEVAGFRYYSAEIPFLSGALGEQIQLSAEPTNQQDPNAIMVLVRRSRIGYINRLQAPTFLRWMTEGRVHGFLERLNGSTNRPRAFIFVRVDPKEASRAA
jgi:hypothetical protein